MKRRKSNKVKTGFVLGSTLSYIVMGFFALLTIYPIIWMVMNSFKTNQEYQMNRVGLPIKPVLLNYTHAWEYGDFSILIGNSVIYTIVSTVGVLVLSMMAGFAFAKLRSKATPVLYNIFLIGILFVIQSIMVPLYILMNQIGLYNTRLGVIIPYIGLGLPTAIYMCTEYIRSIPNALVESARMDGASFFSIFTNIITPMATPVVLTLAILNITGIWNEFTLINVLASSTGIKSIQLGILRFSGSLASNFGYQFAGLTIGMMPLLIFYFAFQKQIARGVVAGAVKD